METIKPDILKNLYYQMLRIRMVEERIAERYPEQEMRCPVHLCIGQEAVATGVCASLSREDYALSNHRSHAHYLAKGGDLKAMIAELYGKATGCSGGKGGSMHLVDISAGFLGATPIVGSTVAIAVGVALGTVMQSRHQVTAIFFGDATVEEGAFHESVNFAALKKLPIIFVCENNLYAVQSPLSVRQPGNREIYELAKGHGITSYQGDGNDVIQVYKMAKRAVNRARKNLGPTFLEFKTYRWREHCGPYDDFNLGYRTESEVRDWQKRCPIKKLKENLLARGILCNHDIEAMVSDLDTEIVAAFAFARESPFPDKRLLLGHVYAPIESMEYVLNNEPRVEVLPGY
jgi:pyruvate dehydrogenase E1 component alpha subunit